jgi:hypothetical protein
MEMMLPRPTEQESSPPRGAPVHLQNEGSLKKLSIARQILSLFLGSMPLPVNSKSQVQATRAYFNCCAPKSRNSSAAKASTFRTPSLTLPSAAMHFSSSAQVVEAGQEKRASMQRTALGRGEQEYCGCKGEGRIRIAT